MATFSTPIDVPEQLYHTVVQCFDPTEPESPQLVFPLGTHTTLATAKDFARNALQSLGYSDDDFEIMDIRTPETRDWTHGDGVLAWARAPNDWEISVCIDTKPNAEKLPATDDGTDQIALPSKDLQLHYVIQTTIDRNKDETRMQHSEIEGVFVHRAAALKAARRQLAALSENGEFAQYESRESLGPCTDWPYGEDVVVHAIGHTGENYYIAVATLLDSKAHNRHHRKRGTISFGRMASQMTGKRGGVAT
ncbi:Bifunctional protein RIB2 [Apiospora arundinis]